MSSLQQLLELLLNHWEVMAVQFVVNTSCAWLYGSHGFLVSSSLLLHALNPLNIPMQYNALLQTVMSFYVVVQ